MGEHFSANQVLGRLKTIGCTAVEITEEVRVVLAQLVDDPQVKPEADKALARKRRRRRGRR